MRFGRLALAAIAFCHPGIAAAETAVAAGTLLRADLAVSVKFTRLRPGVPLTGVISQPLYVGDRIVVMPGLRFQAVVDRLSKHDAGGSRWKRFLVGLYAVPEKTATYTAALREARCVLPDGRHVPLAATIVGLWEPAVASKKPSAKHTAVVLRLDAPAAFPDPAAAAPSVLPAAHPLPAGTRARLMLLAPVSSSRNREGDIVRATLVEPVLVDGRVAVPAGALFEGRVTRCVPSRWLQRAGTMQLAFDRLLPAGGGAAVDIPTSVVAVESPRDAKVSLGLEGTIHAGPRSVQARLIQVGAGYALGKLVDDLTEEGIKMGLGAAAAGTATTVARYVGFASSAVFLLAQHGRDVRLPQFTTLEVALSRPLVLAAQ